LVRKRSRVRIPKWAPPRSFELESDLFLRFLSHLRAPEICLEKSRGAAERDKLIVRVLADCGIGVGELVKLKTNDFEECSGTYFLNVAGKGARERLVPFGSSRRPSR